jgi:hypothetical protein
MPEIRRKVQKRLQKKANHYGHLHANEAALVLAVAAACPSTSARPGGDRDADAGDAGTSDAGASDVFGGDAAVPDGGIQDAGPCGCMNFECYGPYGNDAGWLACPPGTICALEGVCVPPRYSIGIDDTVSDQVTGLVWQRTSPIGLFTLGWGTFPPTAADHCAGLNADGGTWRVPDLPELWSLVNLATASGIDPAAFPSLEVDVPYWTSTVRSDWSQGAAVVFPENYVTLVYVNDSSEFGLLQDEAHVLCVESPGDMADGGFVTPGSGETPDASVCTCASPATCTDSCGLTDQWAPSCFALQCDAQTDGYDTCGEPTCGITTCTCTLVNGGCTLCGKGSVCVAGALDGGFSQGVCTTPHYEVGDAGTVLDEVTGLEWQQVPSTQQFILPLLPWDPTANLPATYCQTLALDGSGWRVPTLPELWSLVDINWSPAVDPVAFPFSPDVFATSTVDTEYEGSADVSFDYGWSQLATENYEGVEVYAYVRCVRNSFLEQ